MLVVFDQLSVPGTDTGSHQTSTLKKRSSYQSHKWCSVHVGAIQYFPEGQNFLQKETVYFSKV